MSEKLNIKKAKFFSLINAFENFGYKPSTLISQKEFRIFLNKRTSSGYFDSLLCDKLFQILNLGEKTKISVDKYIQGFLIFEEEITRNDDSFKLKYAKEKEIYNKILKQCELYKSEKLNAEGFCKNSKIYGEITDIDIRKKLQGIKEIIILVIFNNKREELHFKIGSKNNILKKSFEFRPTSRKDHFEFVMKGINDRDTEFDIGSKIFPLNDITSQEEYFVQIVIPEIDNPNEVGAFINATIVLYMSDFKFYENLRKKQEKILKRYKKAVDKSAEYLKSVREIYGDLTLIKPELTVDFINEKLMQRKGAKLNVNIDNEIELETPKGNYYVEFNNERETAKKGVPLKIEFNNAKPIMNPLIETKKIEYKYKTNYTNNFVENNFPKYIDKENIQEMKKIEKENINENIIPKIEKIPQLFYLKSNTENEKGMKNSKFFSNMEENQEKEDNSKHLNQLIINTKNHQVDINNKIKTEQTTSSGRLESKSDLKKIIQNQNFDENISKNEPELKLDTVNIISSLKNIQSAKNVGDKIDVITFQNKSNINNLEKIEQQQPIKAYQNIIANKGLNNNQKNTQSQQGEIQINNANNLPNINNNKMNIATIVQKNQNQNETKIQKKINTILNNESTEQENKNQDNSPKKLTEYDRAIIYQIVNDISKKKTLTSQIQTLAPIINKVNYNVAVNKAIINETTSKTLVTENILPVSYLPEKVNKLIISDVTYLPLATTEKKISYNTTSPIIHESQVFMNEEDKKYLNYINNLNSGQNINTNNIINNFYTNNTVFIIILDFRLFRILK